MDWHDIDNFLPKDYSYDHKTVEVITRHRREFSELFFDRIWQHAGFDHASKAYPPKTHADLRNLWKRVARGADFSDHRKHAILFYILQDTRKHSAAVQFSNAVYLTKRWQNYVTGLWNLDRCQFQTALEYLTDGDFSKEFADEILEVLLQHPKSERQLAMAFYASSSPVLKDQRVLDGYCRLLADVDIPAACSFSRRLSGDHKRLFENLIITVLEIDEGPKKAKACKTLASLPLQPQEEKWFQEFLLHEEGRRLTGGRDMFMMRQVATGKFYVMDHLLEGYRGPSYGGMTWDDVKQAVQTSSL